MSQETVAWLVMMVAVAVVAFLVGMGTNAPDKDELELLRQHGFRVGEQELRRRLKRADPERKDA